MEQEKAKKYVMPDPDRFSDLSAMIEKGLPPTMFNWLKDCYGVTGQELAGRIKIPVRTINDKIKKKKTMTPDETERVVRLMRLFSLAEKTFKTREKAEKWFHTSNRALGGVKPFDFVNNEQGAREVENILGRIRHGVFS